MVRSLPLDPQPTARQTREILFHVGHELSAIGARVDHSVIGGFAFWMPPPWRLAAGGVSSAISSGRVTIGANAGEPWRVRYELRFTALLGLVLTLSALLILIGLDRWPHGRLINAQIALWSVAYVLPYFGADYTFRRWLDRTCAAAPVTRSDRRGSIQA